MADFDQVQLAKLSFLYNHRVHFNKWIGSVSMATVLISNGNYSTEQLPEKKF